VYQLYFAPGAASFAVHWMLLELGVPFEARLLDLDAGEHKQPTYLALNPNGLVPTLIVAGQPVYEAAALLLLLAERHPEAGLAPRVGSAERAIYLQWTLHLSNTLQATFGNWFHAERVAGEANADLVKTTARSQIESAWDRVAAHLAARGPYMCGANVSATDFLATMLMRWSRNMPRPATDWPVLRDYVQRMKVRPTFHALYDREGLTEWA
jgi:glutathione S-transferase